MGRNSKEISIDTADAQRVNEELIFNLIRSMAFMGIKNFCICPGGRNAGLIDLITEEEGFTVASFHDERAAGFFAVGKIMATKEPCCVVVTSGTAVGELMPAVMEAYYSNLPLVVLSADRPKRFRGRGAPQTAEQERIFGIYTPHFEDIEEGVFPNIQAWDMEKPCHINICLEEGYAHAFSRFPDITIGKAEERQVAYAPDHERILYDFIQRHEYPFAVVGALTPDEAASVKRLLLHFELPCLLEAPSRLRNDPDLRKLAIVYADDAMKKASSFGYPIDALIRFGGVPTSRLWRDTEYMEGTLSLLSVSRKPFSGSSYGDLLVSNLARFIDPPLKKDWVYGAKASLWMQRDRGVMEKIDSLYRKYPSAEQTLVHKLSTIVPKDARLFLGNSLPIREWDLFSSNQAPFEDVYAVRGLNGIDGQISAFLGMLHPDKKNIGLIGDLTALYDLNAFFALKDCPGSFTLFIINNGGGKIFKKLFKNPMIQNNHSLKFSNWAKMFGLKYSLVDSPILDPALLDTAVVEIVPDQEQTDAFSAEFRP